MTEIIIDDSLDETRQKVINAFDGTDGIRKYQSSQYQVVGETGVSFPRVLWSYGETVYVDLSETGNTNETKIEVRAEKEVPINIGANPEKYKRRFLDELNTLRDQSIKTSRAGETIPTAGDNIETMEEGSGNGTSTLMTIIVIMSLLFFGIWFLMMLSMPY